MARSYKLLQEVIQETIHDLALRTFWLLISCLEDLQRSS